MVFGDEPAASCLYRAELAGAQQVVDEFSGDAQQVSGLLRAVGEPLSGGVALEELAEEHKQFFPHVAGEQLRYRPEFN